MNARELFELWAPDFREWSRWAKPVAFVGAVPPEAPDGPAQNAMRDISWAPTTRDTLIVIDLPGALSVRTGLALISRGYWPVPLFNAASGPYKPAVDTTPIRQELWAGAVPLRIAAPDPNQPPVFLLDSHRIAPKPRPGTFDNRWMTFPQDFPSANLLLSRGLRKAILFQETSAIQSDLAHVVRRWQEAGMQIQLKAGEQPVHPTTVSKPSSFRSWLYVALALMSLRPNSAGGFGSVVPIPGQGGGFG